MKEPQEKFWEEVLDENGEQLAPAESDVARQRRIKNLETQISKLEMKNVNCTKAKEKGDNSIDREPPKKQKETDWDAQQRREEARTNALFEKMKENARKKSSPKRRPSEMEKILQQDPRELSDAEWTRYRNLVKQQEKLKERGRRTDPSYKDRPSGGYQPG